MIGWAAARTRSAQELRDSPWAMPLEGAGKCKNKMHTKQKKRPCDTEGTAGAGSYVLGFTIRFLENYSSIGRIVLNLFHPSAALYASTLSAGTRRTQSIS